MDLTQVKLEKKGDSTLTDKFESMSIKIIWTTENDFDLAALIEKKLVGGKEQIPTFLYFADSSKGNLNEFPFMRLSDDAGQGDTVDQTSYGEVNEEELKIAKISNEIAKIHILAWDYPMVEKSDKARFKDSDIRTEMVDDNGKQYSITLDTGEFANACVMATIDCTNPVGPKIINRSTSAVLKGFENLQQIYDLCHKA